jgi:RimJ/RimL family protein N-acetyltransferase
MHASIQTRLAREEDYPFIVDYFQNGDETFHRGMGVDRSKLPAREDWLRLLYDNHHRAPEKKDFFYVIWLHNHEAIGHSNINKIVFGEEAYMHLHMWRSDVRAQGLGFELVKMSIPYYFSHFNLETLWCEPYALNPAPNKTLKKLGFELVKTYDTIPGWISFHQPVNRWRLDKETFEHAAKSAKAD